MAFLEIKNLHVSIEDKKILNGLTLSVEKGQVAAIMGPNGSGKSTLAYVLAGKDNYKVLDGDVLLDGESILGLAPDERAAKGVFLAFQYPVEIPGVATMTFLRTALNAQRKARGESEYSTPDFLKKVREVSKSLNIPQDMLKRGDCRGKSSKISWTQVETGSAITWKYPSCILRGDNSSGEFYSIAISNGFQQVDSGTKMIHLGKNTSSRIISKGIAAGKSQNTYRGLVTAHRKATRAPNFTASDSLLIGDKCGAHTVPYIEAKNSSATFEHEATTSKISDDQLFYCKSRGLDDEAAVALIVSGFVKDVIQQLPMEFAVEAQKLIGVSLEGSVG